MKKINIIGVAVMIAAISPAYAARLSDYPDIEKYVSSEAKVPSMPSYQYLPDGASYLQLSEDGKKINKIDIKSGNIIETVVDAGHTRENTLDRFEGFTMSPDGSMVMVWINSRPIYRHSYEAQYYFYEIRSRLLRPVSTEHKYQQAPVFSPNGRMIAFMSDNNIYVKKLDYLTEVAVTKDGEVNKIINGVPDWSYQEEFTTTCSMCWSADNQSLCYIKYNESEVPLYSLPLYEGTCDPMPEYALYPGFFTYKYPLSGQKNVSVSVHSYDIETRKIKDIALSDPNIEYIPRIAFPPESNTLIITTLNREQTRMELYSADPRSTVTKSILTEQSKAWLSPETYENLHLAKDYFVMFSSRTGYDHLYQYAYSGSLINTITSGDYDVTAYYGYDPVKGLHYYQSTSTGAINRVVSKVDRKGTVTNLTPEEGYATADFAPGMTYYTLNYSTATKVPVYTVCSSASMKPVRTISDNSAYAAKYASTLRPEFFTMQSDGNTLNGYIIKPKDISGKRCPVVMYQYSGPGSQQVLNRWSVDWTNYFAIQGYVVVCVDGRGTGGRGRAFQDIVYRNLGHYETIDQINAAKYAASLPFVDPARIGIHGWSFGGYETIMAVSASNSPYAAAVSVAPVTDWRYYDSIYTERYMLTPQANEKGYKESSAINLVNNVKCPLLIMYGTADDNVHPVNTLQYASATQSAGMWLDMMAFPNMNHFINGCNSRAVVYGKMLDYFNSRM